MLGDHQHVRNDAICLLDLDIHIDAENPFGPHLACFFYYRTMLVFGSYGEGIGKKKHQIIAILANKKRLSRQTDAGKTKGTASPFIREDFSPK